MSSNESRVVLIRVQRPGPFAPIQKQYSRRRAGVLFEGEALFRVVDEGEVPPGGYITEEVLKAVKADPIFFVEDPYVEHKKSEPSKLAPFQAKAKEITDRIAAGKVKIAPVPEWQKPEVPPPLARASTTPVPPPPEKKGKKD